jgi:hypothetical protein
MVDLPLGATENCVRPFGGFAQTMCCIWSRLPCQPHPATSGKLVDPPTKGPTDQPTHQPTKQPITKRLTDQPTDQQMDRRTNGPTYQPTDQQTDRPTLREWDSLNCHLGLPIVTIHASLVPAVRFLSWQE